MVMSKNIGGLWFIHKMLWVTLRALLWQSRSDGRSWLHHFVFISSSICISIVPFDEQLKHGNNCVSIGFPEVYQNFTSEFTKLTLNADNNLRCMREISQIGCRKLTWLSQNFTNKNWKGHLIYFNVLKSRVFSEECQVAL